MGELYQVQISSPLISRAQRHFYHMDGVGSDAEGVVCSLNFNNVYNTTKSTLN